MRSVSRTSQIATTAGSSTSTAARSAAPNHLDDHSFQPRAKGGLSCLISQWFVVLLEVEVRYKPSKVPLERGQQFRDPLEIAKAFSEMILEPVETFRVLFLDGTVNLSARARSLSSLAPGEAASSGASGLLPSRQGSGAQQPVVGCSQAVPSKSEEVEDHSVYDQETLSLRR